MTSTEASDYLELDGSSLHYVRLGAGGQGPPIVFLHEGLGSVELWRDFPTAIVDRVGLPGLVYSRAGNGWSSPIEGPRPIEYMHQEGLETLPQVIDQLVGQPPILVGHSDGASIAIIYAGAGHPVEQLILIAPHVFVEPETHDSIRAIRDGFPGSAMTERMAKYHTDPKATFYGWADVWLREEFGKWNIEGFLSEIRCPTMLVQGEADQYGTTRQLDAIEAGVAGPTRRLLVHDAGHSPHLSHPDSVTAEVSAFIAEHR